MENINEPLIADDETIETHMADIPSLSALSAVKKVVEGTALAAAIDDVLDEKSGAYEEVTAGFSQSE